MDANEYFLKTYQNNCEQLLMLRYKGLEESERLYADWMKNGADIDDIYNGLAEITDIQLEELQRALKDNNEVEAGRIVFRVICSSLKRLALIIIEKET